MTLSDFYDNTVLPTVHQRLPEVFPEFGWSRKGRAWTATNDTHTRSVFGTRPDRVQVYDNTPFGLTVHGSTFVPWTEYLGVEWHEAVIDLASRVGLAPEREEVAATVHALFAVQPPPPPTAPTWARTNDPADLLTVYRQADSWATWQQYKPVPQEFYDAYLLGFGPLPEYGSRCRANRLIVPWIVADEPVAFRGRWLAPCNCTPSLGECKHWMHTSSTLTSSLLWNGEALLADPDPLRLRQWGLCRASRPWQMDQTVVLIENSVDSIFVQRPDVLPLAPMCGAGAWRDEWIGLIARSEPRAVVVWLDYDQAGNAPATVRYQSRYNDVLGRSALYPYLVPREGEIARLVAHRQAQRPDLDVGEAYRNPLISAGAKLFKSLVDMFWHLGVVAANDAPPVVYYEWPEGSPFGSDLAAMEACR